MFLDNLLNLFQSLDKISLFYGGAPIITLYIMVNITKLDLQPIATLPKILTIIEENDDLSGKGHPIKDKEYTAL